MFCLIFNKYILDLILVQDHKINIFFVLKIRNDSSQVLNTALPELLTKCQGLPEIFRKIDQLEVSFVISQFDKL